MVLLGLQIEGLTLGGCTLYWRLRLCIGGGSQCFAQLLNLEELLAVLGQVRCFLDFILWINVGV
jgi:hypothetical protein